MQKTDVYIRIRTYITLYPCRGEGGYCRAALRLRAPPPLFPSLGSLSPLGSASDRPPSTRRRGQALRSRIRLPVAVFLDSLAVRRCSQRAGRRPLFPPSPLRTPCRRPSSLAPPVRQWHPGPWRARQLSRRASRSPGTFGPWRRRAEARVFLFPFAPSPPPRGLVCALRRRWRRRRPDLGPRIEPLGSQPARTTPPPPPLPDGAEPSPGLHVAPAKKPSAIVYRGMPDGLRQHPVVAHAALAPHRPSPPPPPPSPHVYVGTSGGYGVGGLCGRSDSRLSWEAYADAADSHHLGNLV